MNAHERLNRILRAAEQFLERAEVHMPALELWANDRIEEKDFLTAISHLQHHLAKVKKQQMRVKMAGGQSNADVSTRTLIALAFMNAVDDVEASSAASPAAAEVSMTFPGAVFTIADVLRFIGSTRKTGIVEVSSSNEQFTLDFVAGELMSAISDNNPPGCRLGEILVAQGTVTQERLDAFLAYHREDKSRIGDALMEDSLASREAIDRAIERQTRDLFQRLLVLEDVDVTFTTKPEPDEVDEVPLNLGELLYH